MAQPSVGQEVLSHCNKCALALAHIVLVIKKDGNIGRCQCKTCGAKHVFKDPNGVKKKAVRKKRVKKTEIPIADTWNEALRNAESSDPKKYSIKTQFHTGEVIDHPIFGQGIVSKKIDTSKIEVLFENEYKTLVHNK